MDVLLTICSQWEAASLANTLVTCHEAYALLDPAGARATE